MSFNLWSFLRSYRPKQDNVAIYLTHPKLKSYTHITRDLLKPKHMWIKYVPYNSMIDTRYGNHIKSGGFLLACGVIEKGKFVQCKPNICTHLLLKYTTDESKVFMIKTSTNYLFAREIRPKIRVTLIGDEEIERLVENICQKVPRLQTRANRS